jgi:hypothetical protein
MTFRRKVFVSQKISLLVDGREVRLQALVSLYGAKYVFEESELPVEIRHSIGLEVEILYKKVPVRCRVVKETNGAGTVYSLRFIQPSSLLLKQIGRDIEENGLPSPWLRALPRLSADVKHLPVPALAVLDLDGETLFLNVKNFTLGGLLLEYIGDRLGGLELGSRLFFDIVTNGGDKISDLAATVTHLSLEQNAHDSAQNRTQLGVRFLPMSHASGGKYKSLILNHCVGLKEETPEPGAEA